MEAVYKILGKVSLTVNGVWDSNKQYDRISIVLDKNTNTSYISIKDVPAGVDISNEEYWQIIGSSSLITVDEELTEDGVNPVQGKAIFKEINDISETIGNIDKSVVELESDNHTNKSNIDKLLNEVFPIKVSASLNKTLAERNTTIDVTIIIKTLRGNDVTDFDAVLINGTEYHTKDGVLTIIQQVSDSTVFNIRAIDGNNSTGTSVRIDFVNKSYAGVVASDFIINETNVKSLTSTLVGSRNRTIDVSLDNQKLCIAYPKEFGVINSIKDSNGFNYIDSYTRTEITINNEEYYVYILDNPTTITYFTQTIN